MSDLWDAIRVAAPKNGADLKDVFAAADNLSIDEKAELVRKLLNAPGLAVSLSNNRLDGNVIVQIHKSDRDALAGILEAIADQISSES